MAVTENKMIKDFVDAIKTGTKEKTKAYESPATVTRIENGVAWVHVPGGVEETPVQLTIAASEGDQVRVRVANGRATIVGNVTSPPTDDRTAREALYNANVAKLSARSAEASASAAKQYAEVAKQTTDEINAYADTVGKTVTQVLEDGETAGEAAQQAKTSAETAWANLAQVQSVLEVAQWIATHGTYVKATVFNPNGTYYTLTATQVDSPSEDDKDSEGVLIYYELDNGIYVRTTDTSVQSGKTYYNVTGTPVAQPSAEHIADYYTLAVSEAMADYVQSHLALTDEGLYVMADDSEWKVLIKSNGIFLINGTDIVSHFSDYIKLGGNNSSGVILSDAETDFIGIDGNLVGRISYGELGVVQITDPLPEWSGRYFEEPLTKEAVLSSIPEGETSLTWTLNGVEHTHAFDATKDYSGTQDQIAITYSRTNLGLTVTYLGDYLEYTFLTERKPSVSEVGILVPVERPEPSFVDVSPGLFGEAISKNAPYLPAYHLYQTYTLKYTPLQGSKIKINMVLVNPTEVEFTAGSSETKTIDYGSWITLKVIYDAQSNSIRIEYVSGTSYAYVESLSYNNKLVDASVGELVYDSQISIPNYIFGSGEPTSRNFTYRFGENLRVRDDNQFIIGRNNEATDDIFIIGNGKSPNNRSNVLTLTKGGNMKLALDTSATSGTDKEIYDALVSLGWDSDVIV